MTVEVTAASTEYNDVRFTFIDCPGSIEFALLDLQCSHGCRCARVQMLEALANFDDHLLEELLEDIEPIQEEILKDLKLKLGADLVVPVFFGVAEQDFGVRPLLEALHPNLK